MSDAPQPTKDPVEAIRDGMTDSGWELVSRGKAVGFGTIGYSHRIRVQGLSMIVESEHASMEIPAEIAAAIASVVLRAAYSDAKPVQDFREQLMWSLDRQAMIQYATTPNHDED